MNYIIINYKYLALNVFNNSIESLRPIAVNSNLMDFSNEIDGSSVNLIFHDTVIPNNKELDFLQQNSNLQLVNTKDQKEESSNIQNNINDKYFFVKVGNSTVKVRFNEIQYIEGLKDYIKIIVKNNKSLVTKSTIKHIENKLPKDLFTRVHKSYIISINEIAKIEFNHIFIEQKKIPIGMQFKKSFYDIINRYRL